MPVVISEIQRMIFQKLKSKVGTGQIPIDFKYRYECVEWLIKYAYC